ncbi:Integrase catalytic domain-containing protein [Citrus sinensis]|uniref:Integrase catalytic domain-containing protein n=1 Tax=Citrus sinensis TaxID=2711 RepID=A0ACB8NYB5_CITSI|nr:Integrase catalytic domain-containing protein [Citrus sinensis]
MVEGETFRIRERSTETISEDTSGGRRDLSNRYSAPVIGGQKIDVENFDGKINFGMWRREVMDALIQIDLDVVLKNKRHLYDEEIWDRMNEKACEVPAENLENRLHAMSQVYGFRMKPGVSMHDHVSRFEKLLTDLKNLDEDIKDEVKAMILLHSLPEEYSHFVTTLIYGKSVIIFKDVCTTLTNLEIQNNNKNSERASSEALVSKDWAMVEKKKGGGKNSRSKSRIMLGNEQPCRAMGIGTIRLKMFDRIDKELKEVRFVPALKKNLISVGALEAKGYKVTIEDGIMKFTHGAMVILQGVRRHNLYYLKGGKKTRVKFGTANHDTHKILEYVYSDVWGPTKTASIGGSHYFVTFVDDFSIRVWVYTMRAKDEVLEIFVKCKKLVETQTGRKIKVLRSDNEGEYTSDPFLQVCQNEGIKRHFTVRHTPQQNGLAERMNRTLLEKVQCMLSNAGLDKKFWAEAVSYASHLVNRLPSAAIGGKAPMEMWSGKHAQDYDSLRIFGCPAYYHVKDVIDDDIPNTFGEALRSIKSDQWKLAMEEEMKSLHQNQTWELVKLPKGKRAIGNKWVYTKKQGSPNQSTPRYKARLVAKGFAQKEGIDYNDVFSLVIKHTSICILLALVAEYELELAELDVKTAFLHGDLEEKIYMIQPCDFKVAGKENRVYRLSKSLYELKLIL